MRLGSLARGVHGVSCPQRAMHSNTAHRQSPGSKSVTQAVVSFPKSDHTTRQPLFYVSGQYIPLTLPAPQPRELVSMPSPGMSPAEYMATKLWRQYVQALVDRPFVTKVWQQPRVLMLRLIAAIARHSSVPTPAGVFADSSKFWKALIR